MVIIKHFTMKQIFALTNSLGIHMKLNTLTKTIAMLFISVDTYSIDFGEKTASLYSLN